MLTVSVIDPETGNYERECSKRGGWTVLWFLTIGQM